MAKDAHEILSEAVERNSAIVLSLPSAGMLRHHKSRFLGETDQGVWVELIPAERVLIDSLIAESKPCGVSFKVGDQKISFLGKPLQVEMEYRVNDQTVLPALLLERPTDVKAIQRRNNYRVRVPQDCDLKLQVWRIPETVRVKDKPNRAAELSVKLCDISVGGLGVALHPIDGQPPKVLPGERLRVFLQNGESEAMIIEGRLRSSRPMPGSDVVQTGIQFKGLQEGMEGRQTLSELTAIIGELQRAEVRRHRLGVA
jgi:c-di-GMP-binding flagellar brake protein YcgR